VRPPWLLLVTMKSLPQTLSPRYGFSLRVASWLLDRPQLGQREGIKRLAGHLLKQPARRGVTEAQSRLGLLLCRECGGRRDRRIGVELLRLAARAGDPLAQRELGRQESAGGR
jgi:TPR repeat protein